MSCLSEFATVDAVIGCSAETSGVDAFALSVIKAERQIRKLFTHLVFQSPAFGPADAPTLRKALFDSKGVYFEGFIAGWDALYPRPMSDLVGQKYQSLLTRLNEATRYRNKIFHGQLTSTNLGKADLLEYVADIRSWCSQLAASAQAEVGYDGFGRNSFRKSTFAKLGERCRVRIMSSADYEVFMPTWNAERPDMKPGLTSRRRLRSSLSLHFARLAAERPTVRRTQNRRVAGAPRGSTCPK